MRLSKILIRSLCIPVLCALAMMAAASTSTFASTTQQTVAQDSCPTLKEGSTDTDSGGKVSVLQTKLKALGKNLGTSGNNGVDGKFGPLTRQAVISFQTDKQISQDGTVGPQTWDQLGGCGGSTSQPQTPKTYDNPVPVYIYQDHTELHNFADCSQKPVANCPVLEYLNKGTYQAQCQIQGDPVTITGLPTNDWWTRLEDASHTVGWVSNLYIKGGQQITGVPSCNGNVPYIPPSNPKKPPAPAPTLLNIDVWKSGGEALTYPCTYAAEPTDQTKAAGSCNSNGSVQLGSYGAYCQKQGHDYTTVTGNWTYNPITNNMWTLIKAPSGPAWLPNVYIKDAPSQTAQNKQQAFGKDGNETWQRVPDCGTTPPNGVPANIFKG